MKNVCLGFLKSYLGFCAPVRDRNASRNNPLVLETVGGDQVSSSSRHVYLSVAGKPPPDQD